MNKMKYLVTLLYVLAGTHLFAQPGNVKNTIPIFNEDQVKPRMRVIIDNDFGGDPDGLFQLVHHLLSPSVDIHGIIGSHLKSNDGFDNSKTTATNARKKVEELLGIMNPGINIPVYEGSNSGLQKR